MLDLRSYLDTVPQAIYRPNRPISTVHELTALQHALEERALYPIIHVPAPLLANGRTSDFGLVTNLGASRELTALAIGIDDHRRAASQYAARVKVGIEPIVIDSSQVPVREVVLQGDDVDLTVLPAVTQHTLDPGPYLTAAHATTRDPESGVDNTSIQRCWIKGRREMSHYVQPASHNTRNIRKYWARNEPCPVAYWIGHHPAVLVGSQAKVSYPESHWATAGALAGAPVRLVPTLTHGDTILVPADAEIVIEGWLSPGRLEADGPFGEYTGYIGPQVLAPVCEVTCITRREDPIYHDYASHLADALVPDNMVLEARFFAAARSVAPSLETVHMPVSGRRFHCFLGLNGPAPGEARDALMAVLPYRTLKAAIAFDSDIDIFNENEVLWAIATRVQWQRDTFVVPGLSATTLDPSRPAGARTTGRIGIDATLPAAPGGDAPRPVPPRAGVPETALARAREIVDDADPKGWPGA